MKREKLFKLSSFLLPITIILIIFIIVGIYLGKYNFLLCDLRYQYFSLFSKLQDVLRNSSSIFYSFSKSLGGSMISTYAYYLMSPINLIIVFFPKSSLVTIMNIILFIKIGLSGFFMFKYINYHYKKSLTMTLIFSTMYSLISYSINYYWNIMWLDGVLIAPLILLGIDKLINERKCTLYIAALFYGIITNYYIGYMLCIFSVIYFFYELLKKYKFIEKNKEKREIIKDFFFYSLLTGLLCAFFLLPSIVESISTTKQLGSGLFKEIEFNFDFFKALSKTFIGANNNSNLLNKDTMHIYTSIITLPLTFFYFINKNIPLKEKVLTGIVLMIFYSSWTISIFNISWHLFSTPQFLNFRYSFLYSLFIIIISIKSITNITNIKIKYYLIFLLIFLIISYFVNSRCFSYLNSSSIIISILFMISYLIILYILNKKKHNRNLIALLILVIFELSINSYISLENYEKTSNYDYDIYMNKIISKIETLKPKENEFYRLESDFNWTFNDSMTYNYYGLSTFLSTIESNTIRFLNRVGFNTGANHALYSSGSTKIIDSFLGIKYSLSNLKNDSFTTTKNEIMPLIWSINKNNYKFEKFSNNFYKNQNLIYQNICSKEKEYLVDMEITISNNKINVKNEHEKSFYLYMSITDSSKKYHIYIHNKHMGVLDFEHKQLLINNIYDSNIEIVIVPEEQTEINENIFVSYINEENYDFCITTSQDNKLNTTHFSDEYIKGNINIENGNELILTTIPYNVNWHVYIDGKEVEKEVLFNTFIGTYISPGEHTIEFIYRPKLLITGIITSFFSLIIILTLILKKTVK